MNPNQTINLFHSYLRMIFSFTQFLAHQAYSCTFLKAATPENPCSLALSKTQLKPLSTGSLFLFRTFSQLTDSKTVFPRFPSSFPLCLKISISYSIFLLLQLNLPSGNLLLQFFLSAQKPSCPSSYLKPPSSLCNPTTKISPFLSSLVFSSLSSSL